MLKTALTDSVDTAQDVAVTWQNELKLLCNQALA